MSCVYQIMDWDRHYENNRSREIQKPDWCAVPNKQDGLGYRRLLRRKCGEAAYGCFVACVLAASKFRPDSRNGWLTDDGTEKGRPWDAEAISLKTGFCVATCEAMLSYTSCDEIAWMVRHDCGEGAVKVRCACVERTGTGTEQEQVGGSDSPKKQKVEDHEIPSVLRDDRFMAAWGSWVADRRERRKPITARAAKKQLERLEAFGLEKAIRALDKAVECGWQGIYDPDGGATRQAPKPPPTVGLTSIRKQMEEDMKNAPLNLDGKKG